MTVYIRPVTGSVWSLVLTPITHDSIYKASHWLCLITGFYTHQPWQYISGQSEAVWSNILMKTNAVWCMGANAMQSLQIPSLTKALTSWTLASCRKGRTTLSNFYLPEQEVAQSHFPRCANHQVNGPRVGRVETFLKQVLWYVTGKRSRGEWSTDITPTVLRLNPNWYNNKEKQVKGKHCNTLLIDYVLYKKCGHLCVREPKYGVL